MSTTAVFTAINGYDRRSDLGPRPVRSLDHDSDHGFCMVCGAVWPCSRARRDLLRRDPSALVR